MNKRELKQFLGVNALRLFIAITAIFLIMFLYVIFSKGGKVVTWSFLTESPRRFMTEGGIFPAIMGTFYLTILSILIALPLGVFTAIYMVSYAKPAWFVKLVRIAVNTLAGVPSIIYGLFGMAVFVQLFQMDVSMLAGSLTLAILALPVMINASEEALRSVPHDFREASLALGATERQTILRVILPTALPNILTGAIISIGRVAGETAPILFTAATFYTRHLPTSVMDEVMALPYHIYALMTEGAHADKQVPIAYGTAVVLLALVLLVSTVAIIIRYNIRKKRKW
ncbi:MAG: phosphate ABC transporter permease PstA [Candidatus Cloacimonetes bacterium]|nr:phosphate ABC transporter permease PstA [Candidatus Cloacimonadota bacterium]MCF7814035.1 phosphate ABC transporter permease PstA [Candidatus Cloacimonadota bacterium]MCF7868061.1 phosphate ABC transporter permease PstA [Candidatus Cloacimonadota bacterium]MCF7883484.1 phosphate ABC transporter permease PstA [Candidatus Cloacimonadota bacterium]